LLDDTHPWSVPGAQASRERIELFATPGEQEQASFAVYAQREPGGRDLHPQRDAWRGREPACVRVHARLVQFAPWHAGRRDAPAYAIQECLILPLRPTFVGRDTCKRLWITLDTPADAAPGVYRGTVQVTARNARRGAGTGCARRPHQARNAAGRALHVLRHHVLLGKAYLPDFDETRYWEAMRAEVRFMRDNQYCRAECILRTAPTS